jgi:hypothetical protein
MSLRLLYLIFVRLLQLVGCQNCAVPLTCSDDQRQQ